MQYLLLGLAALVVLMLAARGFTVADTVVLARRMRRVSGMAVLGLALILLVRGLVSYAVPAALLGLWLMSDAGAPRGPQRGADRAGSVSRVRTSYLAMELDRATGAVRGRVLRGTHAGRDLDDLAPADVVALWQDYLYREPSSAQLLEAYLDRAHPTWRADSARDAGSGSGAASTQPMSREEALEVLGLGANADEDAIRRAHRELMLKLHPDRGGSTFLAAKINEARDVLLGS